MNQSNAVSTCIMGDMSEQPVRRQPRREPGSMTRMTVPMTDELRQGIAAAADELGVSRSSWLVYLAARELGLPGYELPVADPEDP